MKLLLFLSLFCGAATVVAGQARATEKVVRVPPLASGAARYFEVPFEVPPQTESLSVSYAYDKKEGASTLDLGLFGPCGRGATANDDLCGFRGWSGGRRSSVYISEQTASHGYVPGPLTAGTWRVVLGLYRVAADGVEVKITIRFNDPDPAAVAERDAEAAKTFDFPQSKKTEARRAHGYRWYRGDLHMHTFHSDGYWAVKAIFDAARARSLDFVAITEHNTYSHHAEIDALSPYYPNLLVMRGEEVTTYGGHFNVWGLKSGEMADFRVRPTDAARGAEIWLALLRSGAVVSINHPAALCGGCSWTYGDEAWSAIGAAEIWNGAWDAQDESALKKWDELLTHGERVTATGASDSHRPPSPDGRGEAIGAPANFVGAERLTEKHILDAIRAGRLWVAADTVDYRLDLSAQTRPSKKRSTIGETLTAPGGAPVEIAFSGSGFPGGARALLVSGGKIVRQIAVENGGFFAMHEAAAGRTYFRLEVRDREGRMIALTNPIYISSGNAAK